MLGIFGSSESGGFESDHLHFEDCSVSSPEVSQGGTVTVEGHLVNESGYNVEVDVGVYRNGTLLKSVPDSYSVGPNDITTVTETVTLTQEGSYPIELQVEGSTTTDTYVEDFSHGDVNNYAGPFLYGDPYTYHGITGQGVVGNSGYALEFGTDSATGGFGSHPDADNTLDYYPQPGDTFRIYAHAYSWYHGEGRERIAIGFGMNSYDDQDALYVRHGLAWGDFQIHDGWSNQTDTGGIGGPDDPGEGVYWIDVYFDESAVEADWYHEDAGHIHHLESGHTASLGQGFAMAGTDSAGNGLRILEVELL